MSGEVDKTPMPAEAVPSENEFSSEELIAGVAHELNQPLNLMKIVCQSVLRELEKGQCQISQLPDEMRSILTQINRLAELIYRTRLFAQTGDIAPTSAPLDLNELVRGARREVDGEFREKGIAVVDELASPAPRIKGDPVSLKESLLHLLRNAAEALEEKPAGQKKIIIKTQLTDGGGVVEIADNGRGMEDAIKDKIFQPFFSTKGAGWGKGLSLAIVKRTIARHRGRIELGSRAGEGTRFRLLLPPA